MFHCICSSSMLKVSCIKPFNPKTLNLRFLKYLNKPIWAQNLKKENTQTI